MYIGGSAAFALLRMFKDFRSALTPAADGRVYVRRFHALTMAAHIYILWDSNDKLSKAITVTHMDLYELDFGKIILLKEDMAEVVINDGVEMDVSMVDDYHTFLISHLILDLCLVCCIMCRMS